jgi:hypothetical protein
LGLNPTQKKELNDALQNAFDPDGFDRMLTLRLDKKRHNIVSDQEFPEIVFQVIETAERENWTADLVRGALETNPGNPQLLDFVARNPAYDPKITAEQGQGITATLKKTQELLDKQLGFLRSSFELALQNIDVMSAYKKLHDELHNLIFAVFPLVEDAARLLPEGKDARSNLAKYDKTLRTAIEGMRQAAQHEGVEAEESEWIGQLDLGRKELKTVLDDFDKENLETALQKIRDVLETQPTHVNQKLWRAMNSENSRLPELIKVLEEVLTYLKDGPPERRAKFETGIQSLKTLTAKLEALINEHDTWQDVIDRLPEIGDWIGSDLSKFKTRWQRVRAKIAPFYVGKTDEETAADLEKADALIEKALSTAESPAPAVPFDASLFEDYRVKAAWRFYDVDGMLLERCEYLRDIRNQLL